MQAAEQSVEDTAPDPSTATSSEDPPVTLEFMGFLADADSDDEVQLREDVVGRTGRWLVLRRADIVEQEPMREDGETVVHVSSDAEVVVRVKVPASHADAVLDASSGGLPFQIDRWPRRRP